MGDIRFEKNGFEVEIIKKTEDIKKEKKYITKDMLIDEENMELETNFEVEEKLLYFPKICGLLIAVNIIIFILEISTGALLSRESIIDAGALYREGVEKGEYWRMISSMFLHGSFGHLFSNMIMLYTMGLVYEKFYKKRTAVSIYLLSGITGAVLSSLMSAGPSVGASGAIFGMMGANGYYILKNKELFGEINRRVGKVIIIVSVIWIINGLGQPMVDNYAHIGGFIGGIITAALLKGRNIVEYSQIKNNE